MKILVIGGGGREHALVWKLNHSAHLEKIFCAPGNPGISEMAECVPIAVNQVDQLAEYAESQKIDLTVVGPEEPLVMGAVDEFKKRGLIIYGPDRQSAKLEGSKAYAKSVMKRFGIPTARYEEFTDFEDALGYLRVQGAPIVIKADGLAAGKGVTVAETQEEAEAALDFALRQGIFGEAGQKVVIEEFLEGEEVSVLAFCDGQTILLMDSAQDHKAAYDGDKGPNTGGMGAYSPAPIFTETMQQKVRDRIMLPMIRAMQLEGRPYKGILYAGLMLTKTGPQILEFNARFGDPETQPILARMDSDIVPIFEACIDGTLDQCQLKWKNESSVCVVMAANGYPNSYDKGKPISGFKNANELPGVMVFHAGTIQHEGEVLTSGGRVLGVTAIGEDIPTAISRAYEAVEKIQWDGIHYRKDIGHRVRI